MQTPKELMQSRYEAFASRDWSYLVRTSTHQTLEELQDSPPIEWLKLEVINAFKNIVEFKAYYKMNEKIELLHEKSTFIEVDGDWKYHSGELLNTQISKNESCPCGSGKKFKRCCFS